MKPQSESTRLESEGRLVEYVGSGKLKAKKVLITGGEYVSFPQFNTSMATVIDLPSISQFRNWSLCGRSHGP